MDDLLPMLFAVAVQLSGLPATEVRPPIEAMPYRAMLLEICADLEEDSDWQRARVATMLSSSDAAATEAQQPYEHCTGQTGLMAAYILEDHRIVYRDDLDLNDDTDNSFIVHEYVHALQDRKYGGHMFDTCAGVVAAERQAYAVQQKYLRMRGQLLQVGDRLRMVRCEGIY